MEKATPRGAGLIMLLVWILAVASAGWAETNPQSALTAMLQAAESGNWETYVDAYYGEQYKFRSRADRDKLVARFRTKWGPRVISGLREAAGVQPVLSSDGKRAVFKLKKGNFILYKNDSGHWMFHL